MRVLPEGMMIGPKTTFSTFQITTKKFYVTKSREVLSMSTIEDRFLNLQNLGTVLDWSVDSHVL